MEGLATGTARAPLRTFPKPMYSAKMMASLSKEWKETESPLKIDGFSFD